MCDLLNAPTATFYIHALSTLWLVTLNLLSADVGLTESPSWSTAASESPRWLVRKRPAVGKCLAILYSDGQYRGDRWRNDVWGYVALSSQSSEKLSPELSADSFVWSFVCSVSRYPFRLMARIPIEAQVDINFTKKYICHFSSSCSYFASVLVWFSIFFGIDVGSCFCIVFLA